MPPHVPRKRLRGSPSKEDSKTEGDTKTVASSSRSSRRKPTLYDDLDATATPLSGKTSGSLFQSLDDGDSESSLTSLSDEDFEDVPLAKRPRVDPEASDDDEEDFEFEDVEAPAPINSSVPVVSGDLELTLIKDTRMSLTNVYGDKKGPSKRERKVRNATHCLHVLSLLWHNAVRNSWLCDPEVQAIMISHLPPKMWDEVERWRRNSGLVKPPKPETSASRAKAGAKGKRKERGSRDWDLTAKRLEEGAVDMSHGDPLFRLMQALTSWWKQRFKITAPGLRKWGYMALERLDRVTKAYKSEFEDCDRFGERFSNLDGFRQSALNCQGSRDVGAQLFTALLRGLGLEARMIASLQPLGFGWSRLEDADLEADSAETDAKSSNVSKPTSSNTPSKKTKGTKDDSLASSSKQKRPVRSRSRAMPQSSDVDDLELEYKDTDDESVVEVQVTPKKSNTSVRKFDPDLDYPHYWAEILSPVTNKYLSVDPIVKNLIATNREITEAFEPRGQKADKARQVTAYIVGYSPDGTAKDITVRYLKRQVLPGRTKGVRMPIDKIPVYNRHGKVKRYEEFDWFKSAMSGYRRGTRAHPITEIDDEEDSTDLKPAKPEKKEVKEGEETLQYYKQSKEFVLARHLKREEALKRDCQPVKKFKNKAKGGKTEEEDVYLRSDVLQVKSAETWHKQGRAPLAGEQPLKRVPYRAATTNRRREILEAEAATGQKVLQGLYSYEQTNWIIPPPIQNGIIPKNEYGYVVLIYMPRTCANNRCQQY